MNFAAIDIGSNAIRLLFSNVTEGRGEVHFHKASLIRMPVRLGSDSFLRGEISELRKQDLIKTLLAYRYLIEVYKVEDSMVCATSALREAKNAEEVIREVKEKAGMEIRLIDGNLEAELIYSTHIEESLNKDGAFLYIDVGGGSTELTLFNKGKKLATRSFRIGTIRLLEEIVDSHEWNDLQEWIRLNVSPLPDVTAIGTGGNINKLFKITGKKEGTPLHVTTISRYLNYLSSYSYEEKIDELGLRPDRADVIVPAVDLYHKIMKWGKIHEIIVPKIGLADGMVRMLYKRYKEKQRQGSLTSAAGK